MASTKKYIYGNIFINISDRHHFRAALIGILAGALPFHWIMMQKSGAINLNGRLWISGNELDRNQKLQERVPENLRKAPVQDSFDLEGFQTAFKQQRLKYRDGWASVTKKSD
eukprot:TRINITY_DN3556_c0_g1_i1.p1 TRINITY_DN3556_c0_g1~~TRINITY_DN3556_c0_g1_i1.p1  ORF type:complete len:112 (-),score=24.57 TRINITY_DN3556_c0_g1_i1:162-497(-)